MLHNPEPPRTPEPGERSGGASPIQPASQAASRPLKLVVARPGNLVTSLHMTEPICLCIFRAAYTWYASGRWFVTGSNFRPPPIHKARIRLNREVASLVIFDSEAMHEVCILCKAEACPFPSSSTRYDEDEVWSSFDELSPKACARTTRPRASGPGRHRRPPLLCKRTKGQGASSSTVPRTR